MKNIVLISSLRMVFVYLLLNKYSKGDFFIIDNNVENLNIKAMAITEKGRGNIDLFFKSLKNYFLFKKKLWENQLRSYEFNVFGADHISGASFFLKRYPFYLIEDGTENYQIKNYKRSWKNRIFSLPKFGMHKNVKKIYLTKKENIPDCIKEKVEYIDIKALWNSKTEEEQKEILHLLGVDLDKVALLSNKPIVLFTQPLSEDGILTEDEKITLYKRIISKYDTSKLVIKPHPREKSDYSAIFPNVKVFNETYPSEVLDVLGVEFSKVITLFSTAAFSYPKEKVDFYGTSIHPKLLSRFGNIKYE